MRGWAWAWGDGQYLNRGNTFGISRSGMGGGLAAILRASGLLSGHCEAKRYHHLRLGFHMYPHATLPGSGLQGHQPDDEQQAEDGQSIERLTDCIAL